MELLLLVRKTTAAIFLIALICLEFGQAFRLNILVVIVGENINNGFYACAPYFDIGFAEVSKLYPQLYANSTVRYIYQPNVTDCEESSFKMVPLFGKMLPIIQNDDETMTVLFSPGCTAELFPLGDFAREVNTTLVTTLGAAPRLGDPKRYPTMVFSTGSAAWQPIALVPFLQRYSWTTVTFFCDRLTKWLSIGPFLNGLVCPTLRGYLSPPKYRLLYEWFDSNNNTSGMYDNMLKRVKRSSRIIIVATREDTMREIMIRAYSLNMTNDEYVYIYLEPINMPFLVDLMDTTGDAETDTMAREAYRSLIKVNFLDRPWSSMAWLLDEVANVAYRKYNYTYNHGSNEQINDAAMAAYEAVHILSGLVNESLTKNNDTLPSPSALRAASFDRLWHLPSRDVRTGTNGYRIRDISLSRFNSTSGQFEAVWIFNGTTRLISEDPTWTSSPELWNGREGPPLNIPVCGYDGTLCADYSERETIQTIIASVVPVLACLIVLVGYTFWHEKSRAENTDSWILDPSLLDKQKKPFRSANTLR